MFPKNLDFDIIISSINQSIKKGKRMKFFNMCNRPLEFDVMCGSKIVIPKGTKNVKIAFRQSHLTYRDPESNRLIKMNVYLYKGRVYHA